MRVVPFPAERPPGFQPSGGLIRFGVEEVLSDQPCGGVKESCVHSHSSLPFPRILFGLTVSVISILPSRRSRVYCEVQADIEERAALLIFTEAFKLDIVSFTASLSAMAHDFAATTHPAAHHRPLSEGIALPKKLILCCDGTYSALQCS